MLRDAGPSGLAFLSRSVLNSARNGPDVPGRIENASCPVAPESVLHRHQNPVASSKRASRRCIDILHIHRVRDSFPTSTVYDPCKPTLAAATVLHRKGLATRKFRLDTGRHVTTSAMLVMLQMPLDALRECSLRRHVVLLVPFGVELGRHRLIGWFDEPSVPGKPLSGVETPALRLWARRCFHAAARSRTTERSAARPDC